MSSRNTTFKTIRVILRELFKILILLFKALIKEIKNMYGRFLEKLRFSLTFKITAAYTRRTASILITLGLLILAGTVFYLGWNAEGYMKRDFYLVSDYLKEGTVIPKDRMERLAQLDDLSITLFDGNKNILYTTKGSSASVTFYGADFSGNSWDPGTGKLNENFMLVKNSAPIYYNRDLTDNSSQNFGYSMVLDEKLQWNSGDVYIQIENRLIRESKVVIILIPILIGIDMLFIAGIIISGSKSSRRILKPIEVMTRTVENITINELGTRLDIRGSQDELKDLARTFNRMLDRIQHSYEQQNQFVSDASHELRTPISVIQGYANLLDRWGKDDDQILEESIDAIKSESQNMKDLVEKLLFLARGDKNTQRVEKKDFYINELIEEIIKETKLIDTTHEIKCEKNEAAMINADPGLIKEALRVFIDNSIKYTPKGGIIKINSFLQDREVVITVEDTGTGISKEDLPHIFDRFYRADKSRTRQTGGTGLGLTIAKWIILKHNGRIDVKSEINVGTKISIALPLL